MAEPGPGKPGASQGWPGVGRVGRTADTLTVCVLGMKAVG